MNVFNQPDLVPLWDRPTEFLPLHPPAGSHRWRYASVRAELIRVSGSLDKADGERRVALLANPDLNGAATTDGLNAGIQMLMGGESADAHRHTPSALRVGLEATDTITTVDDEDLQLDPLDVVLNPSGTWHGHTERGGTGAVWLDVVDLPLVSALGGVFFAPNRRRETEPRLDPPSVPSTVRYGWPETEARLAEQNAVDGVRGLRYGDGSVMNTMAVTAYGVEAGATLARPADTGAAVVLIGRGGFDSADGPLELFDVVGLRSWTRCSFTSRSDEGIVIVIDTSPALRALGLYRQEGDR